MNIQDLGSTGEFIAAIATLVTLVYLAGLAVTHLGADTPEQAQSAAFLNSFFRLYELYFSLAQQNLLDASISESYERVIRLFTVQKSFQEWWAFSMRTKS